MSLKDDEKRKAYQREYHKKWYAKPENAAKQKAKSKEVGKEQLIRNRKFVWKYKGEHPCTVCGETRPQCLDFHHNGNDKSFEIANMMNRRYSIKRIQSEIEKCDIVCKNCHADLHFKERKGD